MRRPQLLTWLWWLVLRAHGGEADTVTRLETTRDFNGVDGGQVDIDGAIYPQVRG